MQIVKVYSLTNYIALFSNQITEVRATDIFRVFWRSEMYGVGLIPIPHWALISDNKTI